MARLPWPAAALLASLLSTRMAEAQATLSISPDSFPPYEPKFLEGFDFPHLPEIAERCPLPCADLGPTSSGWGEIPSLASLGNCDAAHLLVARVVDPEISSWRVCAAGPAAQPSDLDPPFGPPCVASVKTRVETPEVVVDVWSTAPRPEFRVVGRDVESGDLATRPVPEERARVSEVESALELLEWNMLNNPSCDTTVLFAKSGPAVVGLYVGAEVRKTSVAPLLRRFRGHVGSEAGAKVPPRRLSAQACGERSTSHTVGIVADFGGNIWAVRDALRLWSEATCIKGPDGNTTWADLSLEIIPALALTVGPDFANKQNPSPSSNTTVRAGNATISSRGTTLKYRSPVSPNPGHQSSQLFSSIPEVAPRAECKTYTVKGGDNCWRIASEECKIPLSDFYKRNGDTSGSFCSNLQIGQLVCCTTGSLPPPPKTGPPMNPDGTCAHVVTRAGDDCSILAASRCNIKPKELYEYNGGSDFCTHLKINIPVCCSEGRLPDLSPKKGEDGGCYTYTITGEKLCWEIENEFFMKPGQIEKLNRGKTWAFVDCANMLPDMRICLSEGDPPMPPEDVHATCGPQVVGTKRPTDGTPIAELNPCPLNVCCNNWGNCGTTEDFCVDNSISGLPGTRKPGTNSCISNCGFGIVNNDTPPKDFIRLAYFEGWNMNRPCLHMDVTDIDDKAYTHVHFAFGNITPDFQINVEGMEDQWERFVKMDTSLKKIISFGGWAFSTELATVDIFRRGVKTAGSREVFATNVAAFIRKYGLNGVDIDWEYPGADDIDDSTPGSPDEGRNYLLFLRMLRSKLDAGHSLAIAAPASYWYLRWFPIADIAKVVDYIVYMTYDLQGQWDYDTDWGIADCPQKNCLRSHVNITGTMNSLAMITRAGVPSNKVLVGVSSYGRSFKMVQEGCTGPMCQFLGTRKNSPAAKGACTETGGYLADAEINQIIANAGAGAGSGGGVRRWHDEDSDSDIMVYSDVEWVAYMSPETKRKRTEKYRELNFLGTSDWAIDLQADYSNRGDTGSLTLGFEPCDTGRSFGSVKDIEAAASGMSPECTAFHIINALKKELSDAVKGLEGELPGYDELYPYWFDSMISSITSALVAFIDEEGPGADLIRCFRLDNLPNVENRRDEAVEVDCREPRWQATKISHFWIEARDQDEFDAALLEHGIDPSWVTTHKVVSIDECAAPGSNYCWDSGIVYQSTFTAKTDPGVLDPRRVVEAARDSLPQLEVEMESAAAQLVLGLWDGSPSDVAEVIGVPLYLVSGALDKMKEVKEMGREIKEAKDKALALAIVEGLLFLLPLVGQAVGGLGRAGAQIGRMFVQMEKAGGALLDVYDLVNNPEALPGAAMDLMMNKRRRGPAEYSSLAAGKRKMDSKARDGFGKAFARLDPQITSAMGEDEANSVKPPYYSPDEVVQAITDYYAFLCRTVHPPEALKMPPEGGWEDITPETMKALKCHDYVVDIIRRLPYIHLPDGYESQVFPETYCIEFPLPHVLDDVRRGDVFPVLARVWKSDTYVFPPDCLCLAIGRRDAYTIFLDLGHETVIWYNNDGAWNYEDYDLGEQLERGEDPRCPWYDSESDWREEPTYDIKYFFGEFCRKRINDMNWIGHPDGELRAIDPRDLDAEDLLRRQMLVDAGFPGDGDGGGFDYEKWSEDERHYNF